VSVRLAQLRALAARVANLRFMRSQKKGTSLTAANEQALRRALEAAGVEFIREDRGGPSVRLKRRVRPKSTK
jgi:hypothetical protein